MNDAVAALKATDLLLAQLDNLSVQAESVEAEWELVESEWELDGYPMLSPNLMGSTASPYSELQVYGWLTRSLTNYHLSTYVPNVSPQIWWVAFHQQIPSYLQLLKQIREQSQLSIHKPTHSPKLKMLEEFFNPTILLSYLHTSTFVIFVYHLII